MTDPYRHHPGLRGKIADPEASFFRSFRPADLDAQMAERGLPADWRFSDAAREADRRAMLAGHSGDLWVFAYGSLMWDPALRFAEVRRGFLPGLARRFILKDTMGGRGTDARPGAMAALDTGDGCHGLVFRIAARDVDAETDILWRRERLMPAYRAAFHLAETDHGDVTALTFVADRAAPLIAPDMSRDEVVRYLATGTGFLGTSLDYIRNLCDHFAVLRIDDPDLLALCRDAEAAAAALPAT